MALDVEPFFEVVNQDEPFARRLARRQQQRMIPAGVCTRDRARGKSSSTVRLEPFETQRPIEIPTVFSSDLHPSPLTSSLPRLLNQFHHQPCPARSVTRADTCPVATVGVFAEQYVVASMRIVLKSVRSSEHRTFPLGIPEKD